jgi:RNA polymerase sigma factor (sigma-70 family)
MRAPGSFPDLVHLRRSLSPCMSRVGDASADVSAGGATQELERLYREQGDRIWRALYAYTGDPEVASDALAEAFAQALRRGDAIREADRWVWRSAFRIAAGEMKRRRSEIGGTGVETAYEMDEPARELLEALRSLSSKQRAAVVLHHAGGYPVREVAAIIGSTTAAVKVHLMRGRRRLRELLEDEDA